MWNWKADYGCFDSIREKQGDRDIATCAGVNIKKGRIWMEIRGEISPVKNGECYGCKQGVVGGGDAVVRKAGSTIYDIRTCTGK